jgi:hypothetical protein
MQPSSSKLLFHRSHSLKSIPLFVSKENTFTDFRVAGQVLLTVTYPTKVHPDMKLLEESLVQMLEVQAPLFCRSYSLNGRAYLLSSLKRAHSLTQVQAPLCAWQKLSATPV